MALLPSSDVALESTGSDEVGPVAELEALVEGAVVVVGLDDVVGPVELTGLDELDDTELVVLDVADDVPWVEGAVVVFVISPGGSVP